MIFVRISTVNETAMGEDARHRLGHFVIWTLLVTLKYADFVITYSLYYLPPWHENWKRLPPQCLCECPDVRTLYWCISFSEAKYQIFIKYVINKIVIFKYK